MVLAIFFFFAASISDFRVALVAAHALLEPQLVRSHLLIGALLSYLWQKVEPHEAPRVAGWVLVPAQDLHGSS